MEQIYAVLAGHAEWALYALSLLAGALPDVLASLQRRGFGRRGGFGRSRRRGGIFGSLLLFFLLGPIVLLALVAFAVYGAVSRMRQGR